MMLISGLNVIAATSYFVKLRLFRACLSYVVLCSSLVSLALVIFSLGLGLVMFGLGLVHWSSSGS